MGLFDIFKKEEPKKRPPVRPVYRPGMPAQPDPQAENNFIIIILDSCRYDSFMSAEPKNITKRFQAVRSRSASPTQVLDCAFALQPSHRTSSAHVADERLRVGVLQGRLLQLQQTARLERATVDFASMVPGLWLPDFLRNKLGYKTCARVSLPVLNPKTGINRSFDDFQLMDSHNDMSAIVPTA